MCGYENPKNCIIFKFESVLQNLIINNAEQWLFKVIITNQIYCNKFNTLQ